MATPKKDNNSYKNIKRQDFEFRSPEERVKDFHELYKDYTDDFIKQQASRCQDCGVPFCHGFGCPLSNNIPDFNDFVFRGMWKEACELLHRTSNFPEFTGHICPALCEEACTLNVGMEPVTIRNIELVITEKGFENGWIKPMPPKKRIDKSIAIIGSGPAGLVAAQELCRMGYSVTVFEKDEKPGGFLRYGIPDYKLPKSLIDRRIDQLVAEGVVFKTGVNAGTDVGFEELKKGFDVILLTLGSRSPRDLKIKGRELKGIYFATDYLKQSNKRVDGKKFSAEELIDAKGKNVVVIGGGDTGSDCIGTARRQGAKNVCQLEILPRPSESRDDETPWPMYAKKLRTSSSHEEGCSRYWSILTKEYRGDGSVKKVLTSEVEWISNNGKWEMKEIPGTEKEFDAEIVFLAMGFEHPVHDKLVKDSGIELDTRGNIKTNNFGYGLTSVDNVYSAGDAARGASLVVWAFNHAREAAKMIDNNLRNKK